MAKGNKDLELLVKMMGQFGNENDNVVVIAARNATKQLAKLGVGSWEEFCHGHFTIAADPFEGLNIPGFTSTPPMDHTFRRGVAPNPPPQPSAPPSPPPRPAAPQAPPNPMHASASGSMGTSQQKRSNTFRAVCYKCQSFCNAGEGYLDGRNPLTNQWKVMCIDSWGCDRRAQQAKVASTKKRAKPTAAQRSTDNLANMLGD